MWWPGKPTEELYHGYRNVGTAEHGNVLLCLIVRPSVRLRVRLRRVHKANSLPGIFVNVMSIARSNMTFQQMKLGTTVISHFRVILTGQSISDIIFMTLQGQKINLKVKQGTCVGLITLFHRILT